MRKGARREYVRGVRDDHLESFEIVVQRER